MAQFSLCVFFYYLGFRVHWWATAAPMGLSVFISLHLLLLRLKGNGTKVVSTLPCWYFSPHPFFCHLLGCLSLLPLPELFYSLGVIIFTRTKTNGIWTTMDCSCSLKLIHSKTIVSIAATSERCLWLRGMQFNEQNPFFRSIKSNCCLRYFTSAMWM